MPPIRLTQRRVDALRPRRKVRDIRDAELKGYGVRVMPSGARRYFIHSQHRGKRVWKIIGDAAAIAEPEARARARPMLAALRDGREPDAADPRGTLFETVAEEVFGRYGRRWKPRTLDVNRAYLRRQILPFFAGRPIGEITREDVRAWFRGLHATPAAANRSAPILSVIMQLCEAARGVLDRLPRSSGWVFPVGGLRIPWLWLDYFWRGVREEAGLQDVRLHDTRHSYASMALLCGESVRAVGRLLGQRARRPP